MTSTRQGIFVQGYLQTLDTFGQDIPPIWFNDIYVGYAILKAPGSDAMTTQDFMDDEGMELGEAMAAAVAQLEGAEVYTPPHGQVQPPYPDVFMSYAGLVLPRRPQPSVPRGPEHDRRCNPGGPDRVRDSRTPPRWWCRCSERGGSR